MIPSIDLDYPSIDRGSSDMTIERAVTIGKKLRAQKPSHHRTQELHTPNVKITNNLLDRNYRTTHRKRNKPRKQPKITMECFKCQCSSQPKIKQKMKGRRASTRQIVLSMRIAELAVPTKRQCLDTWRHKSYVLPAFMVERLQQYVMDQRPIVQIQDAIYCFKKRKDSNKKFAKYAQKNGTCKCNIGLSQKTTKQIKSLCTIFGHKIVKKLSPPSCISVGPSLNNISEIVSRDIANIIYRRKTTTQSYLQYKTVHKEMTNKIVAWIVNILEDASEKRLLEALQELEEEEGPVLDFIDELVDGVVIACEPTITEHLSIKSPVPSCEDSLGSEDLVDDQSMLNEPDVEDIQIENLTDTEYFNDLLKKLFEDNWEISAEQFSKNSSRLNLSVENIDTIDIIIPEDATESKRNMSETDQQSYEYVTSLNMGNETKEISPEVENSTVESLSTTELPKEISLTPDYQNTYISEAMVKDTTDLFFDAANNDILSDTHTTNETLPDTAKTITNELRSDILSEIMGLRPSTDEQIIKGTTALVPEIEDSQADEIGRENEIVDMNTPKQSGSEDEQVIETRTENEMIDTIIVPALKDDEVYETSKENEITAMHATITPRSEDSQVNKSPNQNDFDEKDNFNYIEILNKTKLGEDLFDDTDKKVKFSDMNVMVNFKTLVELPETSQPFIENPKQALSISSDYKFDMNFNAPNLYLLNDVDEVWPADLIAPLLKASSSVSKSISSLGIVLEMDETKNQEDSANIMNSKIINFVDDVDVIIETTEDKSDTAIMQIEQKPQEIFTDFNMKQNKDNRVKEICEVLLNNADSQTTKELTTPKSSLKVIESLSSLWKQSEINVLHSTTAEQGYSKHSKIITENIGRVRAIEEDKPQNGTIIALKPDGNLQDTKFKHVRDQLPITVHVSNPKFYLNMNKALGESIHDKTFIKRNIILKPIGNNICKPLENSTNSRDRRKAPNERKVLISSGPSWIFDVSPNDNLIYKFQSFTDIHKWCRDLDQAFTNLEVWMNWFNDTCRNIIRVQNVVCTPCMKARKETLRTTLLENIQNDGKSWSKLYQNNKKILTRHLNSVPLQV